MSEELFSLADLGLTDKAPELSLFVQWLSSHGPRIFFALVVLSVGWVFCGLVAAQLRRFLEGRRVDPTLAPYLASFLNIFLKILLVITVAGMVGVETTSLAALIGATGFAIGLALQGNLANFAGGLVLLVLKPFKVGDFVEASGEMGTVKEMTIFHTILLTTNNIRILIPNGGLVSGIIKNYSAESQRRAEFFVGISYSSNIQKAREIALNLLSEDERVLKDPAPVCVVTELGESSVNLTIRAWAKLDVFWPMYFENLEKIKLAFDAGGIEIPFPQRTLHITRPERKRD